MKIIFLDVDGVLNYEMCKAHIGIFYGVEQEKVKLLKKIVDATGAKIILSSTWRKNILVGMPLECQEDPFAIELMSKLKAEDLKIYDLTSVETSDDHRKQQILERIGEYRRDGQQVESWVVLDDDIFDGFNDPEFRKHFVWTSWATGLTEDDVNAAINILNGEQDD